MGKKSNCKFFALLIIVGIFVILVSNFVLAETFAEKTSNFFAGWQEGEFSKFAAKWIFLIILALFIYTALDFTKIFGENRLLTIIVALLVSFLATAYITPDEITGVLMSYGAMGLTLGAMIPFAILFFFAVNVIKENHPTGIFLQRIMWIMFFLFLLWKLAVVADVTFNLQIIEGIPGTGEYLQFVKSSLSLNANQGLTAQFVVLLIITIAAFFLVVFNNWFVHKISGELRRAYIEAVTDKFKRGAETLSAAAKAGEAAVEGRGR